MAGTVENPIIGDLWDFHAAGHWIAIPVNLQGIHGRGLAKQALDKGFLKYKKNTRVLESPVENRIFTVAVKGRAPQTAAIPGKAFSERVTGENVKLLYEELKTALSLFPKLAPGENIVLCIPFLGLGFGEGEPAEILPILRKFEVPGVLFVKPSTETRERYVDSFVPGVRRDKHVA